MRDADLLLVLLLAKQLQLVVKRQAGIIRV
jgi:hypothetical protein